MIKKLRDDNDSMKKEYGEKVAKLHIQLLDREYYNNSTLDNFTNFFLVILGIELYIEASEPYVLFDD